MIVGCWASFYWWWIEPFSRICSNIRILQLSYNNDIVWAVNERLHYFAWDWGTWSTNNKRIISRTGFDVSVNKACLNAQRQRKFSQASHIFGGRTVLTFFGSCENQWAYEKFRRAVASFYTNSYLWDRLFWVKLTKSKRHILFFLENDEISQKIKDCLGT